MLASARVFFTFESRSLSVDSSYVSSSRLFEGIFLAGALSMHVLESFSHAVDNVADTLAGSLQSFGGPPSRWSAGTPVNQGEAMQGKRTLVLFIKLFE